MGRDVAPYDLWDPLDLWDLFLRGPAPRLGRSVSTELAEVLALPSDSLTTQVDR